MGSMQLWEGINELWEGVRGVRDGFSEDGLFAYEILHEM